MIKLYCGGTFPFCYLDDDYKSKIKNDYRWNLLGSDELFLNRQDGLIIKQNVQYIGPFYFESDGMVDEEIVAAETQMLRDCTHAIFLLDEASCPGTISELLLASTLKKSIAVFYIQHNDDEETESSLHTPCWFAILMSKILHPAIEAYPCSNYNEASDRIKQYVDLHLI